MLRKGDLVQVPALLEQRAKEDVLQKEVRVKILKDNIKLLAANAPSGGQELTSELNVVLENYQLLCNRIRGKCHTLEVRELFWGRGVLRSDHSQILGKLQFSSKFLIKKGK